ncbi:tetratricopeptide repeat protein [Winogradskyella sp.]|uniref:tetratricopeptide repeat protein n=1 Tax=Winogradskyella sp. TaxID=1883156 RepID=UPI0025E89A37|nr:tetratricopeptide repeat protein [Winogradskyella sp.]
MNLNNISQKEFERIEAYLNGLLLDDDLTAFENILKKEDGFKAKVEDIKTVLTGIETQVLKEQLDIFHKDIEQTSNDNVSTDIKVRTLHWKKIAVAAALIIAAGSFWLISGDSNERLYSQYFTPDPGLPTTMSSTNNYEFYDAMVNYKQGDYKTAISKWEVLQKAKPNNDTINYFIGVAHLANKNEETAISFLENSIKNDEFPLVNDAYYYLGLAYLKEGNLEKAKANFKHSNIDNSKALLSKLND